jgi:sugar lactone lactonase YvrE
VRREPDGSLVTHADLTGLSKNAWNEIVVDGRGAYVNTGDAIALVMPGGGSTRRVADGGAFPNGK